MSKIFSVSILTICLFFSGCQDSPKIIRVDFIDQNAVSVLNKKPNQTLFVGITESGKLSLNKIETGRISDASLLSEKLAIIFDDREKAGISEREVVIDRQGKVKNENLEKLIGILADVKASPILVIKND